MNINPKTILIFYIINFQFAHLSAQYVQNYNTEDFLKFADYLYSQQDYLRAVDEYQRYLF